MARSSLQESIIADNKEADFQVLDNDLLTAEHEGLSCNEPRDVYFGGKK